MAAMGSGRVRRAGVALAVLVTLTMALGNGAASAQSANALAIEARHAFNAAESSALPADKLRLLREALELVQRIRLGDPDSDLAAKVTAGRPVAGLTIAGLSEQIATLEGELGPCFQAPNPECLLETAIAEAEGVKDVGLRALALGAVATALARSGDAKRAERYLEIATGVAHLDPEAGTLEDLLEFAVWSQAALGKYEEALAAIPRISQPLLVAWSYVDVASEQSKAGLDAEALATIDLLRAYARSLDDPALAAQAIAMIAVSYARMGMADEAVVRAYDAHAIAGEVKDWSRSDLAFTMVAAALSWVGEAEWAWRTANQEIADPSYRCVAQAFIADGAAEAGFKQEAENAIASAWQVCPALDESDGITDYGFVSLARAQAQIGDQAGAVQTARSIGGAGMGRAWALAEVALLLPQHSSPSARPPDAER